MEDAYAREPSEVLAHFSVDASTGLTEQQILEARLVYGQNELAPDKGTPFWKLVLKQFDDLLVKILIAAAVVDLIIALINGESGLSVFVEPGVIVLILIANATVGVVTENNAEKAIEELKAYEADVAMVLRDKRLTVVPARDLVPGDIVEIAVGAKVPADMRVLNIFSSTFRADQSILTGESGSVAKFVDAVSTRKAVYQDKTCLLFSGTVITAGKARAVVVGTGPNTAIGKIRDAMAETVEELTPLKQKLEDFGQFLSKVIAGICLAVWLINIPRFNDPLHGGWVQGAVYYFKIAVALAVAAIPEGLPAVVTTCLALGTRKMAKRNAIVRSLPSVETLGCTTVICSDKTGTLTTNQMSVARVAVLHSSAVGLSDLSVTGSTYAPEGSVLDAAGQTIPHPADQPCLAQLAACAALCNDSSLYFSAEKGSYQRVGEATEVALRVLAEKVGLPGYAVMPGALASLGRQDRATFCNDHWQRELPKVSTLEFSRDRKMMSVRCRQGDRDLLFVKGAPESVLACCTHVLANDGSGTTALMEGMRDAVMGRVTAYGGAEALRCLALACKTLPLADAQVVPEDEAGLTLLGLVGMHDPPRPEVAPAIELCRVAGIRVIVVTGDNKATAEAVCRQIGVLRGDAGTAGVPVSVSGLEFDELAQAEQQSAVEALTLFARVEPSHKSRLVELLKAQGHVVAMTGDGVNDAPALKRADIGIAMGSGTAVAKHAADMVLADDNFASIVAAVGEGRAIYANTKQFIRYMVSSNIGEVVAIFFAALIGMPEVLNPVQLLWVNLVTDGLPATALGFNPPDRDIMRSRPRRQEEGIIDRWLIVRYAIIGLYVGCATVAGFGWWFLSFSEGPRLTWYQLTRSTECRDEAACAVFRDLRPGTVAMTVLVVVEMFNALNALSENNSLLQLPPWRNPWLLGAIALSMALHCAILYVRPLSLLFSVTALGAAEWRAIIWLSLPVIAVDEVLKYVTRNHVAPYSGSPSARRASANLADHLRRWLPRRMRRAMPLDLPTHFSGEDLWHAEEPQHAAGETELLVGKRNGNNTGISSSAV
ncbi:hypothetical protein WJX81_005487 [Elliptochloris bilobata]|uniref:Calcium-transporting ATPase n=1 Tax=Elliptochloris bilobata TaxID=381761 RepID=A0AAW1S3G0_9CHLO